MTTYRPPAGPGAITTPSPISRADPCTGRLAEAGIGGSGGGAVEEPGVSDDGVGFGEVSTDDPALELIEAGVEDDGGDGLVAAVQANTSRPATIAVAIPGPPDGEPR